jgi:hypothetical protein
LLAEAGEEGRDSKEKWQLHVTIVGARLFPDERRLLFKNWDRHQPKPSVAERVRRRLSAFFSYFRA